MCVKFAQICHGADQPKWCCLCVIVSSATSFRKCLISEKASAFEVPKVLTCLQYFSVTASLKKRNPATHGRNGLAETLMIAESAHKNGNGLFLLDQ